MHENLNVRFLRVRAPSFCRLLYFGLVRAVLPDVTGGKAYDVAVDFSSYRQECAVGAIKARAKKRVMWIHNDVEIKRRNEPKYRILWHFFKGKLRCYDAFAAVSPGIIDGFRRTTGISRQAHHGHPQPHRHRRDLPQGEGACRFHRGPGQAQSLLRGPHLPPEGLRPADARPGRGKKASRDDFHFYLIGDGPDRGALEAQIALAEPFANM